MKGSENENLFFREAEPEEWGDEDDDSGYRVHAIRELLLALEKSLMSRLDKASLADYVRLLQLERELEKSLPKDIEVTWIDPPQMKSASDA